MNNNPIHIYGGDLLLSTLLSYPKPLKLTHLDFSTTFVISGYLPQGTQNNRFLRKIEDIITHSPHLSRIDLESPNDPTCQWDIKTKNRIDDRLKVVRALTHTPEMFPAFVERKQTEFLLGNISKVMVQEAMDKERAISSAASQRHSKQRSRSPSPTSASSKKSKSWKARYQLPYEVDELCLRKEGIQIKKYVDGEVQNDGFDLFDYTLLDDLK